MKHRKFLKLMSTGVTILGIALCVPATMLAQSTSTPDSSGTTSSQSEMPMHRHRRPSAKRQLRHLTKMLDLTTDQQQQMLPILQDQDKQMQSIRNDTSLSPQQRREQARTLMQDTHQKLEALMTDTQKQKFEQEMQQRRQRWHVNDGVARRPGGTPPPPPPDGQNPPPPPPQR